MSVIVGCALGCGLLLTLAPFLWPRVDRVAKSSRSSGFDRMRARLTLAGLGGVPPVAFFAICAVCGVAVAALVQALLGVVVLTAVAGCVALLLPGTIVSARAKARRRAGSTVWPDVVDHLVSAVRSGLALPDSVSALAHTGPDAARAPFAAFERDYRASGNFSVCVDRLKARLSDPVADRILETLRMARDVGGSDLTTVLRALAAYLREETAIRQEVEARQSWVLNAGRLGVAAPWIVLLLLSSRPEARVAYNTAAGTAVIVCGLLVSVIAYRIMLALGRLPQEQRWFQ